RHAIAEDRVAFAQTGADDDQRPVTEEGARKMRRAAAGLRSIVPSIDLLAASPLVRAVQTAGIVAAVYGAVEPQVTPTLTPGSRPSAFLHWLQHQPGDVIAAVGHEPDLGILASWLVSGVAESWLPLKKGASCFLEFSESPR